MASRPQPNVPGFPTSPDERGQSSPVLELGQLADTVADCRRMIKERIGLISLYFICRRRVNIDPDVAEKKALPKYGRLYHGIYDYTWDFDGLSEAVATTFRPIVTSHGQLAQLFKLGSADLEMLQKTLQSGHIHAEALYFQSKNAAMAEIKARLRREIGASFSFSFDENN